MGTIQSGIGLISGLNITSLVDQLMAIEARPRDLMQTQASNLTTIKMAWLDLSARLLALRSLASSFDDDATFQAVTATSSNTSALTVTAAAGATPGSYRLTLARLVANHQAVSAGWPDSNTTAVGAGTITIDLGHGRLDAPTALTFLNGQSGVARGSIRITDRTGASAVIDLSTALTAADVLDAINAASGIRVTAEVHGDRIRLIDTSGSTSHDLAVEEVNGGTTAAGLGLLHSVASATLDGDDVVSVNRSTVLDLLNDGTGVRTRIGDDIKFTLEDGAELLVDLSNARTLGDVIDAINAATGNGGKLVAALAAGGDGLTLTDTTGGLVGPLTVEAVSGSKAAADLGLLGSDGDADHVIAGRRLAAGLNSVLLRNLNGGSGVSAGSIHIQDRSGSSADVDLSDAQTVQDVLDAINAAGGVCVVASLNAAGNGILVTDTSGGNTHNFVVAESGGTTAADLNIVHDSTGTTANSGHLELRYVSENTRLDDLGITRGKFTITDSAGHRATVDLTQGDETTLGKVITEINTRGIGVVASINAAGNGLLLTDTAGGAGRLTVAESGSTTAADLGILGGDADDDGQIDGARRLDVAVAADDTLQDIANAINAAGRDVSASIINDGSAGSPYRLVISSGIGGQAGRMTIDVGTTGLQFATLAKPADALLYLGDPADPNAIAIRSSSNTLADLIDNVTVNLVGTSASPVDVTVSGTVDGLVSQLKSFTTNFNSTAARIGELTKYDSTSNTRGALLGDATASRIRDQLFALITAQSGPAGGTYRRLTQVGFSITSDGQAISFDESKFRAAYARDPAGVRALFTQEDAGVGDRIDAVLNGMTDAFSGTITGQVDALDARGELLSSRITQLNALLERKRARLLRQFQAMESALAQLQAQSTALASFSSSLSSLLSWYSASGSGTSS